MPPEAESPEQSFPVLLIGDDRAPGWTGIQRLHRRFPGLRERQLRRSYARTRLMLYQGATIEDPVDGMYSFAPALLWVPRTSSTSRD